MEKREVKVIASVANGSHGVNCKVYLTNEYLNKKIWVGIYVVLRQYDNNYCQYQIVDNGSYESIISFDPLPDGIYEVRLFEDKSQLFLGNKYERLAISNRICIGEYVELTRRFDDNLPYLIHVSYKTVCSADDRIGLFLEGTHSMKEYISEETVSITKNEVIFDTCKLRLDAVSGQNELVPKRYEFRYFKNCSSIANTTAPSGFSIPFSLPQPTLTAKRVSIDYININFKNNHNAVWVGLFKNVNEKFISYEYAKEDCDYVSLKYKYIPNEHYFFKLFSNSNQFLAQCELSKSENYI